jgi:hypothetical protein
VNSRLDLEEVGRQESILEALDAIKLPPRDPRGPFRMSLIDKFKDMGTVVIGDKRYIWRLKFCLAVKNGNFGQLSLNNWQPADFVTFHLSNLIQSDSMVKADDCRISYLISCT